jgi:hypothetical protein
MLLTDSSRWVVSIPLVYPGGYGFDSLTEACSWGRGSSLLSSLPPRKILVWNFKWDTSFYFKYFSFYYSQLCSHSTRHSQCNWKATLNILRNNKPHYVTKEGSGNCTNSGFNLLSPINMQNFVCNECHINFKNKIEDVIGRFLVSEHVNLTFILFNKCLWYRPMSVGLLVTTAWRVLRLRMEEKPSSYGR